MYLSTRLSYLERDALELENYIKSVEMCAGVLITAQDALSKGREPVRPIPDLIEQLHEAIKRKPQTSG